MKKLKGKAKKAQVKQSIAKRHAPKPSKNPHIDPRENAFADNDSMGGETGRYLDRLEGDGGYDLG